MSIHRRNNTYLNTTTSASIIRLLKRGSYKSYTAMVTSLAKQVVGIEVMQLIYLSNLLVTINSSVNFFIYCTFGQKFRTVFMQMFCGQKPRVQAVTAFRSHATKKVTTATKLNTLVVDGTSANFSPSSAENSVAGTTTMTGTSINIPLSSVTTPSAQTNFSGSGPNGLIKEAENFQPNSNCLVSNSVSRTNMNPNAKCEHRRLKLTRHSAASDDHTSSIKSTDSSVCHHKHHCHHRKHSKNCRHSKGDRPNIKPAMPLKIPNKKSDAEAESTTSTKNAPTDNNQFHLEETPKIAKCNSGLDSSWLDGNSQNKTFVNYSGTNECNKVPSNALNVDCSALSNFQGQKDTKNNIKNVGSDKSNSVAIAKSGFLEDEPEINQRCLFNSQRPNKGIRQSPNIIIVATTPVTTFHSDGKISTSEFTPDKASTDVPAQKLSSSEGSIRFTDEYHKTFI